MRPRSEYGHFARGKEVRPAFLQRELRCAYFFPGSKHGHVHRGDVLEDVWQPPGRPRLSISSTSRSNVTGFFSFFMRLPPDRS